jgi:hypothetical protein
MIVFTTAFVNIGRDQWGELARTYQKYIDHFHNMMDHGFEYTLLVYSHGYILQEMLKQRSYKPNIMFIDLSGVDTFLKDPYLALETEIMKDPEYLQKVHPRRRPAMEHSKPTYTLLTHSKMCFLKHTRTILPSFTYYAWIDFGYPLKDNIFNWPCCPYPAVPKSINFSLLERKIHIGTTRIFPLEKHVSEEAFLMCNFFAFNAFTYIIHTDIFDDFFEMYTSKLESWQKRCLADDEQNLMYQLFQDHPDLFKVFKTEKSPWGLFPENLNMGAEPNVLHP